MKLAIVAVFFLLGAACGHVLQKQISLPTGRVVGGENAKPGSAKYIVSLQSFGRHFCGGSIIDAYTIATAAHCVKSQICSFVSVVAGLHDLRNTQGSQRRTARKCISHEKYGSGVGPYDIAIIVLGEPLDLSAENVAAVALPENEKIHEGDVTLHGWGSTSTSSFPSMPKILQTVTKPIVPYEKCEAVLGGPQASPLHKTNVCTGPLSGGISACSGDSGGPLVQKNENGEVELVGIVSWGYIPCGSKNAPSVYTRVSAFVQWIQDKRLSTLILQ